MQSTELVDLILIFAPHFDLILADGGFFFFGELGFFSEGVFIEKHEKEKKKVWTWDLGLGTQIWMISRGSYLNKKSG